MLPLMPVTASRFSDTSGSACRMGSAISSTGGIAATEMAMPARAAKALFTCP